MFKPNRTHTEHIDTYRNNTITIKYNLKLLLVCIRICPKSESLALLISLCLNKHCLKNFSTSSISSYFNANAFFRSFFAFICNFRKVEINKSFGHERIFVSMYKYMLLLSCVGICFSINPLLNFIQSQRAQQGFLSFSFFFSMCHLFYLLLIKMPVKLSE